MSKRVLLDISTGCPAKCKYCLHQVKRLVTPRIMQKDNFIAIVDTLKAEGFNFVYLYASGEPLLNKYWMYFILYCASKRVVSNLATKLTVKIDFKQLREVLHLCAVERRRVELLFTVDTLRQETQKKIAPGIKTDVVLENLDGMKEVNAQCSYVKMTAHTVVNRYNEDELGEIKNYFNTLGIKWAPRRMGYFIGRKIEREDVEMMQDMLPKSTRYPARFTVKDGKIVGKTGRCTDRLQPVISPEGDVAICCRDMLYECTAGNILEAGSLNKILQSDRYMALVEKARKMELSICQGCN